MIILGIAHLKLCSCGRHGELVFPKSNETHIALCKEGARLALWEKKASSPLELSDEEMKIVSQQIEDSRMCSTKLELIECVTENLVEVVPSMLLALQEEDLRQPHRTMH